MSTLTLGPVLVFDRLPSVIIQRLKGMTDTCPPA